MPNRTAPRRRIRLAALVAAVSFAAAAPGASAQDAFDGAIDIGFGDSVTSSFPSKSDAVHQFSFYGVVGSRLRATVRADAGSSLKPGLRLARPGGTPVDTGRALSVKGGRASIDGFRLPFSGWFVLEVSARDGAGAYTLRTGGTRSDALVGLDPGASGERTHRFRAVAGSKLSVKVKPRRGSAARPRITGLEAPDGAPIRVNVETSGRTSSISEFPLDDEGTYTLLWTNEGPKGDVALRFAFVNPKRSTAARTLPPSVGVPSGIVDSGEPVLAPREGHVGSAACGRCHDEIFRDWSETAHNLAVRTWDRAGLTGAAFVNDANANGKDDFRDQLDLATTSAFAVYGSNAPRLIHTSSAEFPYRVRIGTVTYDVHRTMGGNGLWKQRYLTKIGRSYYVLPVQYNDAARSYAAYNAGDWYDASNLPRYTAPDQVAKSRSFEANCSGCHNTGETVEVDANGEWVTGHADFNIGCEQCHGPGAAHAATGDTSLIRNPRTLLDGTPEGVAAANDVCARCHTRGEAVDAFPGTAVKAGFGFSAAGGVQQAGDDPHDFFVTTTKPSDFWGRKTNPYPPLPGDTFVASRSHRQQSLDMATGNHGPNSGDAPTCFACHDPHRRAQEHQIVRTVDQGGRVTTATDDNSLCLACHAGVPGPFLPVSKADAAQIVSGTPPDSVVRSVVRHMADSAAMPVAPTLYDPVGTGVGRCTTCHMVMAGRSAVATTDNAGYVEGDLHAHTFETIWPRASVLHGVTNSCNTCHPTSGGDGVAAILAQWASDDDGDGTFHSDTPRSFQNGVANPDGAAGGQDCASCHTTAGFVATQVQGRDLTRTEIDDILKDSIGREKGITCEACHGARSDGSFGNEPNPLRMPARDLCGSCHNNQTVVFEDFLERGEMVRHPQREMLGGTAGAEVPNSGTYGDSFHSATAGLFEDGCITCHYDASRTDATHSFSPQVSTCSACHGGLSSFNRPSSGDWDGDGVKEGGQDEVQGLLDVLRTALDARPQVSFSGGYFEYAGATDHKMTGASEAEKRAAFNWYSVGFDASLGVHNAVRTVQLLQRSYRELTGSDVPGADLR